MPRPATDPAPSPPSPPRREARLGREPHGEMLDPAEAVSGYERSPEDLLRLIVSSTVLVLVVVLAKLLGRAAQDVQSDVVELLSVSSVELVRVVEGLLSLLTVVLALLTLALPLFTRRLRILGYVLVATLACGVLMAGIDAWAGIDGATNAAAVGGGVATAALPDASAIAASAAAIVVFGPFVTRRWRHVLWSLFGAMVVLQVVVSVHPPVSTAVALTLGPAVGSATLLALGRPTSRPTRNAIVAALRTAGLDPVELEPASVDARGSTPYFGTTSDGSRLFVKVLGANERAADLMFRTYRRLRLRNVGDERPDSTLRRTVEHEALVSLQARDVGIATPRMRGVARVGQDSFLLAYDLIPGASLDSVDPTALTDAVLEDLWSQVALMREHCIAHRDLRLANVFLAEDATVRIIDFGFAEVAADDLLLRADVAQLLASLAVAVGVDRATSRALRVLGPQALADAVPRLQLPALSGATRTALKEHPGVLQDLRDEVATQCGAPARDLEPLTRFRLSHGVALALAALGLFVGLPWWAGFDTVAQVLEAADWSLAGWLLPLAALAVLADAWSLYSAPPVTLPAAPTVAASTASLFASTTGPATLGGRSLEARFLERHGLDPGRSAAAVALRAGATTAAAAGLALAYMLFSGGPGRLVRPEALWWGLLVLVIISTACLLDPATRSRLRHLGGRSGGPGPTGPARAGLRQLEGSPSRPAATVAASALTLFGLTVALDTAIDVVGGELPFATVSLCLLVGWLVASLVPTPAHLGAVEVALLAGLVAAGLGEPTAVCAILLYRLFAFWLPVLVGWPAFGWLARRGDT